MQRKAEQNPLFSASLTISNRVDELEITDGGIAFDPFAEDAFIPSQSLETALITGKGIHLIKSFSNKQEYSRSGGYNKIRLSFAKKPEDKKQAVVEST